MSIVCFRLSYIYLSLVLRRSVLIKGQWIFGTHFNYFICQENVGNPILHKSMASHVHINSLNLSLNFKPRFEKL